MSLKESRQWWKETRADPEKLNTWLQRQYVGELAAVNLLSEVLMRFGPEMTQKQWNTVKVILDQEMKHAKWIHDLLRSRNIEVPVATDARERYWSKVYKGVNTLKDAMAAAENAENMRLWRIVAIAESSGPYDIVDVFEKILPDEEFHERAFHSFADDEARARMKPYHGAGMELLF